MGNSGCKRERLEAGCREEGCCNHLALGDMGQSGNKRNGKNKCNSGKGWVKASLGS